MSDILDNPNEPRFPQHTRLAHAIRVLESISVFFFFASLLLMLQSWLHGLELRLLSFGGLAVVYMRLFTMRLKGLRNGLSRQEYIRHLFAGLSLGTVFLASILLIINHSFFYFAIMVWIGEGLRVLGFIGVIVSLFLGYVQPQGINQLSDIIYSWLSTRLWIVAVLGALSLVSALR